MPLVILSATTSANESKPFEVVGRQLPAHFTAPGLAGSETATLQKRSAAGGWSNYFVDGTLQQITATNSGVVAYAVGIYRLDKSSTVAAVPGEVSTDTWP